MVIFSTLRRFRRVSFTGFDRGLVSAVLADLASKAAMVDVERRFLLLNSDNVFSVKNMVLEIGSVEKHPANPLFAEDKAWEQRFDNFYGNIIFDPEDGLYKCWYSPFIVAHSAKDLTLQDRQEMPYEGHMNQEMGVCYAQSWDGIDWEKPNLGLVDYDGNKRNNLVMRSAHGAGVLKDELCADVSRRYKSVFQGLRVSFSSDGLAWSNPEKINCELAGDTHNNALWVPRLNKYVAFTRDWIKTDREIKGAESKSNHSWCRQVARIESSDFVNWSSSEVVIESDCWELQPYSMAVFEYADIYLGLLVIHDQRSDRAWTELAYSVDTIKWQRIDPGQPLIGCSDIEWTYDYGCVYACAGPVFLEDEVRLYYGGSDWLHFGWRNGCLALATMRPDGFAGYKPVSENEVGKLTTAPIVYRGEAIKVTADIEPDGYIEIKILDNAGAVWAEHRVSSTATDQTVVAESAFELDALQIEFTVHSAQLFSFLLVAKIQ